MDKVTGQCPQTTTFEVKGEPKRYRTEVLPLTSLTPYHSRPFEEDRFIALTRWFFFFWGGGVVPFQPWKNPECPATHYKLLRVPVWANKKVCTGLEAGIYYVWSRVIVLGFERPVSRTGSPLDGWTHRNLQGKKIKSKNLFTIKEEKNFYKNSDTVFSERQKQNNKQKNKI